MNDASSAAPAAAPSPVVGLGIVAIVVVAVIGWAIIGSKLFSDVTLFGGFLLLWHYANIEQLDIKRLPAALLGALSPGRWSGSRWPGRWFT